jgi:segregation and condensation protein A
MDDAPRGDAHAEADGAPAEQAEQADQAGIEPLSARPRLEVATPVFEGPLELLLALCERDQIDLFQVSLAAVTESYLMEQKNPVEMAEFLWLAARLLLLKSIRLLPGEEPEPEEAELLGWEEDVRRRLQEYRQYKQVAEALLERTQAEIESYPPPPRDVPVAGQEQPLDVGSLLIAFQSLLQRLPPRPVVMVGHGWTVEDKVDVLEDRLQRGAFDLAELILESEDRLEAVITFVALLELLRRGAVRVRQDQRFASIWVEPR